MKTEKIKVIFIENNREIVVEAPIGLSLLEVAHNNNINLEGACEGSLACATCHVILEEKFYKILEQATEAEEDMLDLAFGLTHTSRLGCQVILKKELNGMKVIVPSVSRNISI